MTETAITLQPIKDDGSADGAEIVGQFNPASLQYTITNNARQGNGNQRSREVQDSVGKLTFDLIFDTTDTGADVREKTQPVARLMQPGTHRKTPVIKVSWGAFEFRGALEQYRETLDYFAIEGVPLRATLSLGFTTVPVNNATPPIVFTFAGLGRITSSDVGGTVTATSDTETVEIPVAPPPSSGGAGATPGGLSASQIAAALGASGLARMIGAANGLEDIRNPLSGIASVAVSGEPVLEGPVAFASGGGASFGAAAGFGASVGASAGFGVGAGASASFGVASVGAGGNLSAGVGAAAGAFARIGPPPAASRQRIDLSKAFGPSSAAAPISSANIEVGGRVRVDAQSGFVADVGQDMRASARLQFEED